MADPNFQNRPKPATTGTRVPAAKPAGYRHNHPALDRGTIKVGDVVRPIGEAEYQLLQPLGLLDGKEIPPNLADKIKDVMSRNPELYQDKLDVPPDHTVKPGVETPWGKMSSAAQAEVLEFVNRFRYEKASAEQEQSSLIPGAGPGVNEAISHSVRGPARRVPFELDAGQPPAAPETVFSEEPPPVATPHEAGAAAPLTHCPSCQHDLSVPDVITVEPEDIALFFATVLAGERFCKEIPLYSGRVRVCFHDISAEERELCFHQVAAEVRSDPEKFNYTDPLAGRTRLLNLLFTSSIKWIQLHQKTAISVPPASHFSLATYDSEWIAKRHEWIYAKLFGEGSGSLSRIIFGAWEEFNKILGTIEKRAFDPNFGDGIDKPSS